MKKLLFALLVLVPQILHAQEPYFQNEAQSAKFNTAGTAAKGAVDRYGNLQCSLKAGIDSATNPIKLEDSVHTSADAGIFSLNVVNESAASLGVSNLDYGAAAVSSRGAIFPDLNTGFRVSSTLSPLKPEDEAFANTSALMMSGGVNNRGLTGFNLTQGDAIPFGLNDVGALYVDLSVGAAQTAANSPIRREDSASADLDTLMLSGNLAVSAVAQSVGTSGDYAAAAMDLGNRQIVTYAPSGEIVAGCNTAITTNTTGTIIAATASKFTFVTTLSCTNTGATATRVILEDGAGNDLANVMLPATTGFATISFASPVRTSVVNSVIQANVITTGSSTICCASGYVGVI